MGLTSPEMRLALPVLPRAKGWCRWTVLLTNLQSILNPWKYPFLNRRTSHLQYCHGNSLRVNHHHQYSLVHGLLDLPRLPLALSLARGRLHQFRSLFLTTHRCKIASSLNNTLLPLSQADYLAEWIPTHTNKHVAWTLRMEDWRRQRLGTAGHWQ